MRRNLGLGVIAAISTGGVLAAIDAHDFSREPPTDNADVVATIATAVGAVVWLALRWADPERPRVQLIRVVAAGIALGAAITGLASVVYDPFAD